MDITQQIWLNLFASALSGFATNQRIEAVAAASLAAKLADAALFEAAKRIRGIHVTKSN